MFGSLLTSSGHFVAKILGHSPLRHFNHGNKSLQKLTRDWHELMQKYPELKITAKVANFIETQDG